jgi:diguanylate cyclase (GGDEF)-like protein
LLALDIRDFKGVNEILGRKCGDELLVQIAKRLAEFQSFDGLYGRLSGDKFGIMIERKYFHAGKICKMLNDLQFTDEDTSYTVILHMGVYEIPENDSTPIDIMFDRASFAISKIKTNFEERIAFYDEIARRDMLWEQTISS